ncbi:MAG TPA: porin [Ideonella sp.]|nr:porin [Ideonella sp.]
MKKLMRHAVPALSIAALFATAAHAQSTVQVYGLLDAGVEANRTGVPGEKRNLMVNTGNQAASRLGFRATEDLGGGLSAIVNIELGLYADTGNIVTYGETAGTFWGRRAVVGLQGAFGELLLGREYTPGFWTLIQTDRFRYGLPGTVSTPSQIAVTRANNGVFYKTPNLAGFVGRLAATTGLEGTTPAHDQGRFLSGSLDYKVGKLFLSGAYQKRRDLQPGSTTQTADFNEGGAGLEYSFAPFVVTAGFWTTDPVTATADAVDKTKAYWIGAGMDIGLGQLNLQIARTELRYFGRGDGKALTYGVSYTYPLSVRTALYAAYGGVNNNDGARLALNTGSQRVGGVVFGADPSAVIVGMRHNF